MGNLLELGIVRPAPQTNEELLKVLTPRQLEVLAMLCEGLPNKLIARRMNISAGTVKVHIVHILRALKVSSRLQAALVARRLGFAPMAVAAAEVAVAPQPAPAAVSPTVSPAARVAGQMPPPAAPSRIQPVAPRVKAPADGPTLLLGAVMAKRLDMALT